MYSCLVIGISLDGRMCKDKWGFNSHNEPGASNWQVNFSLWVWIWSAESQMIRMDSGLKLVWFCWITFSLSIITSSKFKCHCFFSKCLDSFLSSPFHMATQPWADHMHVFLDYNLVLILLWGFLGWGGEVKPTAIFWIVQ